MQTRFRLNPEADNNGKDDTLDAVRNGEIKQFGTVMPLNVVPGTIERDR